MSRISILTVCHAEQPIPVLVLRLAPLLACHGGVTTVRVTDIPVHASRVTGVTAIVTHAPRLGT